MPIRWDEKNRDEINKNIRHTATAILRDFAYCVADNVRKKNPDFDAFSESISDVKSDTAWEEYKKFYVVVLKKALGYTLDSDDMRFSAGAIDTCVTKIKRLKRVKDDSRDIMFETCKKALEIVEGRLRDDMHV